MFASAVNAWQFLDDELGGHTRLAADPTQRSVYCGFQARVAGLRTIATPSSGFFVFFPAKVLGKKNLQGGFYRTRRFGLNDCTRTLLQTKSSSTGYHAEGTSWEVSLRAISDDPDDGFN